MDSSPLSRLAALSRGIAQEHQAQMKSAEQLRVLKSAVLRSQVDNLDNPPPARKAPARQHLSADLTSCRSTSQPMDRFIDGTCGRRVTDITQQIDRTGKPNNHQPLMTHPIRKCDITKQQESYRCTVNAPSNPPRRNVARKAELTALPRGFGAPGMMA